MGAAILLREFRQWQMWRNRRHYRDSLAAPVYPKGIFMAGSDRVYVEAQQAKDTAVNSEVTHAAGDGLLAQRAKEGDRNAFVMLTECYSPIVVSLFYGKTPIAEIEDLLQDTLLTAFERLDTLRDSKRFKPWLLKIARHKLIDFHRKRRHRDMESSTKAAGAEDVVDGNLGSGTEEQTLGETLAYRELAGTVRESMGSMSEKYRVVLFLRLIEQMTPKEIATLMELKESTVRMRLSRGLVQLRKKLERAGINERGD